LHNRLVRHDGALSILRGFKSDELLELAQRAGCGYLGRATFSIPARAKRRRRC
jgi:hypothetical protein